MKSLFTRFVQVSLLATLALGATFTTTATTAYAADNRKLVVGIEDGYFPYEYLNEKGEFVGYDVDVINYVCKEIKAQCTLARGTFDALIPNLLYKKTDLVISALSITDERKKRVEFSDVYVPAQKAGYIVNNNATYKNLGQLKTVGVQQGTTLAAYLRANTKYNIKLYPSFDTAMLDLKGRRIDAVFESIDVASKYLADAKQQVKTFDKLVSDPLISQGTAIAFRKNDPLRLEVNKAIAKGEKSGYFAQLRKKYGIE